MKNTTKTAAVQTKWNVEIGVSAGGSMHFGGAPATRFVLVDVADARTSLAAERIAAARSKLAPCECRTRARVYADGSTKAL
jgi:hypothetical protein